MISYAHLYIHGTYQCGNDCEYCYAKDRGDEVISDEVLDQIPEWWFHIMAIHGVKWCHVAFLGGEPLLILDKYLRLWGKLVRLNEDVKPPLVKLTNVLYTNGLLISKNFDSSRLRDFAVVLNLCHTPLDGISKILTKLADGGPENISLVMVLDDTNMGRVEDIAEFCGYNDLHIKVHLDMFGHKQPRYVDKAIVSLHRMLDVLEKYPNRKWDFFMSHTMPSFDKEGVSPSVCGRGLAVIEPDGQVSTCTRETRIVGSVGSCDPLELNDTPLWHYKNGDLECEMCKVKQVCQGGCPLERTDGSNRSVYCRVYRAVFPRIMYIYGQTK